MAQQSHPRVPDGWSAFALPLAGIVLVTAAILALLGYGREALLLLIPATVIMLAGLLAATLARRALRRHDHDLGAADRDADDDVPRVLRDPDTPLGAVSARDLPDGEAAAADSQTQTTHEGAHP